MNLLIADFLFVKAHKDMNINFIKAVAKFAVADVISLNGYYDDQKELLKKKDVGFIDVSAEEKNGSIASRLFSLKLMKKTATIANKGKYDVVLCLGFETILFGIGLSNFKGVPMFVFHHKNIDELTNSIKRVAFKGYQNKVYHVVFEEFFRNRLVEEIGVSDDKVFVIPHPVKPIGSLQVDKKYDCIGLCNSNEESFIQEIIERDKDFAERHLSILLRSKTKEKKDGAVQVINGFIEKRTYDELMAVSKTIFVPLPETYVYRLSGSIYDALSREKVVFTTSKYYAEDYERRYPGTCCYVGSIDQLIQRLQKRNDSDASASFNKFIYDHSVDVVSLDIERIVKKVLKGR